MSHLPEIATPASELERIVENRDQILAKYREIADLFSEINTLKNEIGKLYSSKRIDRIRFQEFHRMSDEELTEELELDRSIWKYLIEGSVGKLMSSKQREDFSRSMEHGDYPTITKENLYGTLYELQKKAPDIMIQSVYDLWSKLSRTHKTNHIPYFGKKLIFEGASEKSYNNAERCYIGFYTSENLQDLWKLCGVLGFTTPFEETPHEARNKLRGPHPTRTPIDLPFGTIKLHKSGTLHLCISEEVRHSLNTMLAQGAKKALWNDTF